LAAGWSDCDLSQHLHMPPQTFFNPIRITMIEMLIHMFFPLNTSSSLNNMATPIKTMNTPPIF
jgi:hypothetical protein